MWENTKRGQDKYVLHCNMTNRINAETFGSYLYLLLKNIYIHTKQQEQKKTQKPLIVFVYYYQQQKQ
jgi:hypothetical protein